jgi:hypothetical protein
LIKRDPHSGNLTAFQTENLPRGVRGLKNLQHSSLWFESLSPDRIAETRLRGVSIALYRCQGPRPELGLKETKFIEINSIHLGNFQSSALSPFLDNLVADIGAE